MTSVYHCAACDEDCEEVLETPSEVLCMVCGGRARKRTASGTQPSSSSTPATATGVDPLAQMFYGTPFDDIITRLDESTGGGALRESIMQFLAMQHSQQTAALSPSAIDALGVLTIDERKLILRDVILCAGPLRLTCIPASFSAMPTDDSRTQEVSLKNLLRAQPTHAETPLICDMPSGSTIVLAKRGVVTFAQKVHNSRDASLLLISQPDNYKWPFQATDSARELAVLTGGGHIADIPVLTIKESDAELLLRYWQAASSQESSTPPDLCVRFGECVRECVVCQESFLEGEAVLKLPCRHVFHANCVTQWLQKSTSCPLCRSALPDPSRPSATPTASAEREIDVMFT